jgi:tetratricopeptide (TPR) repeat protein
VARGSPDQQKQEAHFWSVARGYFETTAKAAPPIDPAELEEFRRSQQAALRSLAQIARQRGDTVGTVSAFRRVLDTFADDFAAKQGLSLALGNLDQVTDPIDLLSAGMSAYRKGDWRAARELFAASLQRDEGHLGARMMLGLSLWRLGRLAEAARQIDRVARRERENPDTAFTWAMSALFLSKPGHLEVATQRFARLLKLEPSSPRAFAGLARVALRQGDRALASRYFRKALQGAPKFPQALLGLAQLALADNRLGEARRLLRDIPLDHAAARPARTLEIVMVGQQEGIERAYQQLARFMSELPEFYRPAFALMKWFSDMGEGRELYERTYALAIEREDVRSNDKALRPSRQAAPRSSEKVRKQLMMHYAQSHIFTSPHFLCPVDFAAVRLLYLRPME